MVWEIQIPPGLPLAATNFDPSADDAAPCQRPVILFEAHAAPELVVYQIRFCSTAVITTPSADEVTAATRPTDALFVTQLAPEFVEVKIRCVPDVITAATNFVPSAEEATAPQVTEGMPFEAQVAPALVDV